MPLRNGEVHGGFINRGAYVWLLGVGEVTVCVGSGAPTSLSQKRGASLTHQLIPRWPPNHSCDLLSYAEKIIIPPERKGRSVLYDARIHNQEGARVEQPVVAES